ETFLAPPGAGPLPQAILDQQGRLFRYNRNNGKRDKFSADITKFEADNDPDGVGFDSDPYGVATGNGDKVVVVDAAGNDLLAVDHKGVVSLISGFPCGTPAVMPTAKAHPAAT